MNSRMDAFFRAMGPFLLGQASVEEVAEAIGCSPSGNVRLALYQTLVARQKRDTLDSLFPAVARACDIVDPALWGDVTREFTVAYPPTHWEPNRFGDAFADFLAEARKKTPKLPAVAEELADYAYIRFAASVGKTPDDGVGLDGVLFVRHYESDVVGFTRSVGEGRRFSELPAPLPTTLLVAWSRTERRVVELQPSMAALAAVGRRIGDDRAMLRPDPPSAAEVDEAEQDLILRGVLAPRGQSG